MARPPIDPLNRPPPPAPRALDARAIEQAYRRGAAKNRRVAAALDVIAREMERDPESLARVLRRWIHEN
ncbi:MAG: hypothetical protein NXI21_00620 [Alphaproteobacteria bacterium]|nr:hypothetical protein [Alphaproteobacteria bacterium]